MSVCAALLQTPPSPGSSSVPDDYESTSISSLDYLLGYQKFYPDVRIRQRLEASRQGMLQLEALRNKHQKLMKEMRLRLTRFTELSKGQKNRITGDMNSNDNNCTNTTASNGDACQQAENKQDDTRSESPISCCFSHRSSVSMDSGCISIASDPSISCNSPTAYSNYRKFLNDDVPRASESNSTLEDNQEIVATAIESTTALRCHGPKRYIKNCQRPKSMCAAFPEESALLVDSYSFSQITPPPMHKKFTSLVRSESVQTRRPSMAESCFDVRLDPTKQYLLTPVSFSADQSPLKRPQSTFHASRVFVERTSRNGQTRPKSMLTISVNEDENVENSSVTIRDQAYGSSKNIESVEKKKLHAFEPLNLASNDPIYASHMRHIERRESCQADAVLLKRSRCRLLTERGWKESEDL